MPRASTVTTRLIQEMKQRLADGVWRPGDTIPSENTLARAFGASRSSVHLAIQKLVDVGILESHQGSGTTVHAFSEAELKTRLYRISVKDAFTKITELRLLLEPAACRKIAPHLDTDTADRLDDYIRRMVKNMDKPNLRARYDVLFHRTILEACGNDFILRSFDMFNEEIKYNNIHYSSEEALRQSADYHRRILDRLKAHDGEGAAALMTEHLLWTDDGIREAT